MQRGFQPGLVGSWGLQPVIRQRGFQPGLGWVVVTMDEGAKEKRVNYLVDDGCIPYSWHEFQEYYGEHALQLWENSLTVYDNQGQLLRVKLTHRSFTNKRQWTWCLARRVRKESEYFTAIIDRWSWNDAAGRKSMALEIPSDFCGSVAKHILDYLQNDTPYWEFNPTIGELDAAHYLGMHRLLEKVVSVQRRLCWLNTLGTELANRFQ